MIDGYLVPEKTVVTAKGSGAPLDVSGLGNRVLLLTLLITNIVEQESLDVSVWGSAAGNTWGERALATFPQKFYRGEHPLLLDVTAQPQIKFLSARWEVNRWGRGSETPMFEFSLAAKEVPKEMLVAVGSK